MSSTGLIERVISALQGHVGQARDLSLQPDTDLLGTGILDSFGIIDLIPELEDRFGVRLESEDIDIAVFETARSIATFLQSRMGEGTHS
jgi:acyl carrier protein